MWIFYSSVDIKFLIFLVYCPLIIEGVFGKDSFLYKFIFDVSSAGVYGNTLLVYIKRLLIILIFLRQS